MVKSSDLYFTNNRSDLNNNQFKKNNDIPIVNSDRNQNLFKKNLFTPFWIQYNTHKKSEIIIQEKIIEVGKLLEFDEVWLKTIIQYIVSEFTKKGLCDDYYGYHNVLHELESAYFTLIVCSNILNNKINQLNLNKKDILYLFVAALFHDYDPLKKFDKPEEDSVEQSIRTDAKIQNFISEAGLNIDIVLALIHRTAYPFKGKIAEISTKRINYLLSKSGIDVHNITLLKKYQDLGWFLSVAERIAGYVFGNFDHAKDIARKNAHALGWHPAVINRNSVIYFNSLKQEDKQMFDLIMLNISSNSKKNFYLNINSFKNAWNKEIELKYTNKGKLKLFLSVENAFTLSNPSVNKPIFDIYRDAPSLIRINENDFKNSLYDDKLIMITLRLENINGKIIGFSKGGPLENYELRVGTIDLNYGLHNTIYLEGLNVLEGYWGETGGHILRIKFLLESQRRGYQFVTGYTHRDVILKRILNNENIAVVQRYDPDKLDYYRTDINNTIYKKWISHNYDSLCNF